MYKITAKARDGAERPAHFAPNTLQACAGAIAAMSCGNRSHALQGLRGPMRNYSASTSAGGMMRAEYIPDSRAEAVQHAQRTGLWPAPRSKPCKYCGFDSLRMSDEDCPDKPQLLRLWHWLRGRT